MSLNYLHAGCQQFTHHGQWSRHVRSIRGWSCTSISVRSSSATSLQREVLSTNGDIHVRSEKIKAGTSSYAKRAQGRCCAITGATSGIGYAITKRLMQEGASHIRLLARNIEKATTTIEQLKQSTGQTHVQIEIVPFDAESDKVKEAKLFTSKGGWPCVDTLVLSAGIAQSTLASKTVSPEEILKVNLEANIQLSSTFLRHYEYFLKRNRKVTTSSTLPNSFCLISISSLLAIKGGYGASTYAASKAGLVAYNRALCLEAGAFHKRIQNREENPIPPFRVNTVLPGYISTPMIAEITGPSGKLSIEDQIPLGRLGEADEVADAVLFLMANKYANNCVLNLDGGLSAT